MSSQLSREGKSGNVKFLVATEASALQNFKWPYQDRLWVYNAEIFVVGSTHPTAPYIQKPGRNSKKVVLQNTLFGWDDKYSVTLQ